MALPGRQLRSYDLVPPVVTREATTITSDNGPQLIRPTAHPAHSSSGPQMNRPRAPPAQSCTGPSRRFTGAPGLSYARAGVPDPWHKARVTGTLRASDTGHTSGALAMSALHP